MAHSSHLNGWVVHYCLLLFTSEELMQHFVIENAPFTGDYAAKEMIANFVFFNSETVHTEKTHDVRQMDLLCRRLLVLESKLLK